MVMLAFDSATMYYRAFYAVPESMVGPLGNPNGAVKGFLDMTTSLTKIYPSTEITFAWDDDWRPLWRVALVPTYKTHRVADEDAGVEGVPDNLSPQITAIAQILDSIGLARIGEEGHEADDILGAVAARQSECARIVTGDRDLFQLIDDASSRSVVSIIRGVRNQVEMTDSLLSEKYGVTGAQYADFATLRGDASDGLPGARGIGEKTAAALVSTYGNLAEIFRAAADSASALKPAVRRALVEQQAQIQAASEVVRVRTDAKLPTNLSVPTQVADLETLKSLAVQWGAQNQVKRLLKTLELAEWKEL
jgi:5'-3' exonuclease